MRDLRAQADVAGAVILITLLFLSSLTIFVALSYYFASQKSYSEALAFETFFDKQNISVIFVQAIPPSARSGIAVINYGEPVQIVYLVEERNSSLVFKPESIFLQHGQSATFMTNDSFSGVMTSYGGLFMSSFHPGMVPVTFIGINVSVNNPQLEYVVPGYYRFSAEATAKWFVNGSYVHAGKELEIFIDGPTCVTAVPVSSHP